MPSSAFQQIKCNVASFITCMKTVVLVLFFYTFSISLTFYNKKFITIYPYPLSITIFHLFIKFLIAWLIRAMYEKWYKIERIELGWGRYCKRIAAAGISSSLDIGFSNWSFEYITVSLYTMTKSTSIVFILFFAILFKLEKKTYSLFFVISFIAVGLFLFTYKSTQFVLEGFLLVLFASFLSGVRWTTAQLVTQKAEIGLSNPLDMIYHVQPWMIIGLLPLSATFEGVELGTTAQLFRSENYSELYVNVSILGAGAVLAFFLEYSEYLLICSTSSLTLSIAGIVKEVCTLYLASVVNGDQISFVNFVGLLICLLGITLHVVLKARDARAVKSEESHTVLADTTSNHAHVVPPRRTSLRSRSESEKNS